MAESTSVVVAGCLRRLRAGDEATRAEWTAGVCRRLEMMASRALRKFPGVSRWEETGDVVQNAMVRRHRTLLKDGPESPQVFFGLAAKLIRRELIDLLRHYHGVQGQGAN